MAGTPREVGAVAPRRRLARQLGAAAALPAAAAERALRVLVAAIAGALGAGRSVQLRGLGTLAPSGVQRRRVRFRPGRQLAAALRERAP